MSPNPRPFPTRDLYRRLAAFLFFVLVSTAAPAQVTQQPEPVDWEMVNLIRQEGLNHSKVMETLSHLTEEIGPRLTGSPGMREANEYTRDRMAEFGLENAHVESWGHFGRGWSFERATIHMLEPHRLPLIGLPVAWTPGTKGKVKGEAMKVSFDDEDDLEENRGKLEGKILFLDDMKELEDATEPWIRRYTAEELGELKTFDDGPGFPGRRRGGDDGAPSDWRQRMRKRMALREKLHQYWKEEGVVAVVDASSRDSGLVRAGGAGSREKDEDPGVPRVMLTAEHYNKVLRLLARDEKVVLEIDVKARFHDDDPDGYNTLAEIPGTDLAEQVVMAGGHLDSWHGATGATDNAAACAVAMEAARILKAVGVEPRRTIRIALWSGEEQGLLGSRGYVEEHFAAYPEPDEEQKKLPRFLRKPSGPLTVHPQHANLSAYFNLDNGAGKIRGVWTQQNAAVVPIFEAWLTPFHDLGADTVTMRNTSSTDHVSFDSVGLPGFQFIQDGLDYFSRTHHTNMDTLDHVVETDLKHSAVVLASFLYHAAMRDELLPRGPMPRDPEPEEDEHGH
jgi:carboxypeptidase Q